MSVSEVCVSETQFEKIVAGSSQQTNAPNSGACNVENEKMTSGTHLNICTDVSEREDSMDRLMLHQERSEEIIEECNNSSSSNEVNNSIQNTSVAFIKKRKVKKRGKKNIKDCAVLTNDRMPAEDSHTSSPTLHLDMIEKLNKVFNSWSLHSMPSDATKFLEKRQMKDNENSGEQAGSISRRAVFEGTETCPMFTSGVKYGAKYTNSCKNNESSVFLNTAISGKIKLPDKKKKIRKKVQEKNECLGSSCEENAETVMELIQGREKKSTMTGKQYVGFSYQPPIRMTSEGNNVSQELLGNVGHLHQHLNSAVHVSSPERIDTSMGTSEILRIGIDSNNIQDNEDANVNVNKRMKELKKKQKCKKKVEKQVSTSDDQKRKKKKEKTMRKSLVLDSTSSSNNVLETSTASSGTKQKTFREKDQKRKSKQFDEYWTLDAVKEGLQNGTVIEGAIRINNRRYTEAYVSSPNGSQDILIEGMHDRNRALEGDLVALLLKEPSEWKLNSSKIRQKSNNKGNSITSEKCVEELHEDSSDLVNNIAKKSQVTGKVVAILSKQHSRKCVGYLKLMKKPNDKNALFSPRDGRIPRLQIPQNKCPPDFWLDPESKKNILYLARITKWTTGTFALGEIVEQIGQTGDVKAETEAILLDNDLDVTPYPAECSGEFCALSSEIMEEEAKRREDLRKECIFTIDPETAKDLDDAVSCKELTNGNLEIGVHISDVSFFLEEGSHLDIEVSKRATSIYLVDSVHHMLPVELALLCSLLPGQDKLAYSVFWEITKDASVVSQRVVRTVIHSCVKLAYEHAQMLIENPEEEFDQNNFPDIENGFSLSHVSKVVNNLQMIAQQLRKKRFESGALRIDQKKIFLHLDPTGVPITVHEYVNKESHRLIEEFMLLANMTVAKFAYEKFPKIAFLRCHEEPHRHPLEQLQEVMASRGIHLNITCAGALQASLTRYDDADYLSQTRHMVLNALCAKTMTRARYFCSGGLPVEEFWHYALSVPYYTHFTSPIRRYADIMVHRLLNSALGYTVEPLWTEDYVCGVASNCNKKKYCAKLAGEQSVKLYLSIYVRNNQPISEDAVVIDVKDHSFDVIVCKYGLTMRVYVTKLDVNFECDDSKKGSSMRIIWKPNDDYPQSTVQVVDIFTIVKVIIRCSEESLKLEAELHRPVNFDT